LGWLPDFYPCAMDINRLLLMVLLCCLDSLSIPPGTKISLTGTITVKESFLMLNSSNTKVLGGEVEKLKEKWELNKVTMKLTLAIKSFDLEDGDDLKK